MIMRHDPLAELRRAAQEQGLDALAAWLDNPAARPLLGPARGTRPLALLLVALLLPVLSFAAVYLGSTAVTALKVGATTGTQPAAASTGAATADCNSGTVVCITADQTARLTVTTAARVYEGLGHTVPGITVTADNVTVQHFKFANCASQCAWLKGVNTIFQDNDLSQVYWSPSTGDDIDAIRFFGTGTKILRNNMHDILVGTDEHNKQLDCIQTFATTAVGGGSANVTIQGNKCHSTHFHQCVMAEGPASVNGGGGGGGLSTSWLIDNNEFECYGNQSVLLDDIHNVTVSNNKFQGAGARAIAITALTTGVTASNNTLGPNYSALVGS
jgi:hypothetical protein